MTLLALDDLRRQHRTLPREIASAAARVLDSGWYVHGPELRAFEEEFTAFVGRSVADVDAIGKIPPG